MGYVPSIDRFNIRCPFCNRYQRPLLLGRLEDDMEYEDYMSGLFEEEDDDEDWDWDEDDCP